MPAVPGVLLDPVHLELPNGDAVGSQTLAEVRVLGQGGIGRGLLTDEVGVRRLDDRRIGSGTVEVRVGEAATRRCV